MASVRTAAERQRAALARANEVRSAAAAVLRQVRADELDAAALLSNGSEPFSRRRAAVPWVSVGTLLQAIPGVGSVLADRVATAAGIDCRRRLGGLSRDERVRLATAVACLDGEFAGAGRRRLVEVLDA